MIQVLLSRLRALPSRKDAQDLIEYALLSGMIATAAAAVIPAIDVTSEFVMRAVSAVTTVLSSIAGN
jgi:hypothetical protein